MDNQNEDVVDLMPISDGGMTVIDRTEIDIQIATAKKYPRQVSQCLNDAETMVTMDKDTAESAFYVLPAFKGSKEVTIGPSIRCAEIIATCWGNLEYGSRPVEIDRKEGVVRALGYCIDRQRNMRFQKVVTRPIMGKLGKLYPEHLIVKTMLAAQAIAERDAICKVVPRVYVNQLYQKAMKVADGEASLEDRIKAALSNFAKRGVTEAQILTYLGVEDVRDINVQQVGHLRGVLTAIKEGADTVEGIFGSDAGDKSAAQSVAEKAAESATQKPAEPKAEEKPTEQPKQGAPKAEEKPAEQPTTQATPPPDSRRQKLLEEISEAAAKVDDPESLTKEKWDAAVARVMKARKVASVDVATWETAPLIDLLHNLKSEIEHAAAPKAHKEP